MDPKWMKELENASAKFHISRLEALKVNTQQQLEVAFGNQLDGIDQMARNVYQDEYYRTAFEIMKGNEVGFNIGTIDSKKLDQVIKKPWAADGSNFSDRVWANKNQMVNALHQEMTRSFIMGGTPDDAIAAMTAYLADKTTNAKHKAARLVQTEQAYFSSAAQKDCFKDLGVEEFEIVASIDAYTCEICGAMDGQHATMDVFQAGVTAPPFHPFCRCTTVPYFNDEWSAGERAARGEDGKTYYVPSDTTYSKWKTAFVFDHSLLSDSESELGKFKTQILGDKHFSEIEYQRLKTKFSHGSDDAKAAYNKYVSGSEHIADFNYPDVPKYDKGKIYLNLPNELENERGEFVTWFHEHGHLIDELSGNVSQNASFLDALDLDFIDIQHRMSYNDIAHDLNSMRKHSAVSDIFDALSDGEIKGVAGHPKRPDGSSYWTDQTICQEAFAHMFECQFDEVRYAEMKKYFPKALEQFEKILKVV